MTSACIPLRHDEPTDLYELIRVRYEAAPILITSNRDIEEWPPTFGDALLASEAMDRLLHRLLHHAHVIDYRGGVVSESAEQTPSTQGREGRVRIRSADPEFSSRGPALE